MSNIIHAADLFCGAGGESTGMLQASEFLGHKLDLLAINHWDVAIETHANNHPGARHLCESIQSIDPLKAIPSGRLNLLWASPECTHHSNARGGRPRSDQSRASAWLVLKWLSELYVDRVIIENVKEFTAWGPLGANGKPLKSRKGETFEAFLAAMRSLGYRVDWRILCAADFGDPTTRRRMFIQAVRGRGRIRWPEVTHTEDQGLFGENRWRPAREIIDWSIPGESIFTRKKPLAPATMARIEAGIQKFWGEWAEPFLILLRGGGPGHIQSTALSLDKPLPTITAGGQHIGLIEPFLTKFHGGNINRNYSIDEPVSTIDCSNRFGLAQPFIIQYYGNGEARSIALPLDTVTCHDRFALIDGNPYSLDIRFRMLQPHELAAAQGFPSDYWFAGTKTDRVKQIGNAVPVNTAKALCSAVMGDAA